MRTIIAGSRNLGTLELHRALHDCPFFSRITRVVCGCAPGIDRAGEEFALEYGLSVDYYPADWAKYGKKAGYVRNREMADNADALVAVWDGVSKGTKHMIDLATLAELEVFVWTP